MSLLKASFFGPLQLTLHETPVQNFRSVNVQGLLAFLMLQADRPFSREALAALFWPDEPESVAKKNLRQALYQVRKLLSDERSRGQPFLRVTRETIQWNPAADYVLDVAQFLTAVNAGLLETAVSLYAGELLVGFTCPSLDFETWLRLERERLHGLALQAMADLGERQLRNGRVPEAEATARRHLALEPWSETAHRQLIEALALAGNRSGALAQFERCQSILADELGMRPEPDTFALVERIQNHDLQPIDPKLIAGRFALGEEIGRGAMGVVFRGQDSQTGTAVAIKKLDAAAIAENPALLARFQREGEALRQLNHPNIVPLLALDQKEGSHYLVMAFIPGGDLRQRLQQENGLTLTQILGIALDLADALTRAHRLEILHRDIKPANVLLDSDGAPRLADFGLARLGQDSSLTAPDNVLGSVAYLSPEACLGETVDARADIWSFGVLLYEMVLGERPFAAPTPAGTITQILNAPLPDVLVIRPDIPDALADLLYRMLTKNRTDRIPSVRLVGAELEALQQAIGSESDPQVRAVRSGSPPSGRAAFATPTPERLRRARHNLPAQTTPFVGREAELAELHRLLADPSVRLVTILGPGGMGKTRLSLEIGRRLYDDSPSTNAFPDGITFVDLTAATSVEEMKTAVAAALGFAIESSVALQKQILNFLSNKRLLLILDNVEQLLASPADGTSLITAVLQSAPGVKLMATSRQKVNLSGELILALEGLAFPEWETTADALNYSAVQLFVQSARRARVEFRLTAARLPSVTRICRLTEGIPLGIVLAAAWIDVLSLAEIADEMQADIDFLASEMGDLPPRQRSMRAAFDYSWGLLTEPEQQILAQLSVFRGGFTREAGQAVTGATLRQLLALLNKSLVVRDLENGRFFVHELLRQLAGEKLKQMGHQDAVRTRHASFYLQAVAHCESRLKGGDQLGALREITADFENFIAGWRWAVRQNDLSLLGRTLNAFNLYCILNGRMGALQAEFQYALANLRPIEQSAYLRDRLLNRLYLAQAEQSDFDPVEIDRLRATFHSRKDKAEVEIALGVIGARLAHARQYEKAAAMAQKRLELIQQMDDPFTLASQLVRRGFFLIFAGHFDLADVSIREGLALSRSIGNRNGVAHASLLLGGIAISIYGEYEGGAAHIQETIEISREMNLNTLIPAMATAALLPLLQGDAAEAEVRCQQVLDEARRSNMYLDRAYYIYGCFLALRGAYQEAKRLLQQVLQLTNNPSPLHMTRFGLAVVAYGTGDIAGAADELLRGTRLIPLARKVPASLLWFMPVAAGILAATDQHERAVELLAVTSGHPACPHAFWEAWSLHQDVTARLQAALSPEAYAAAQARGRELAVRDMIFTILEDLKAIATSER